MRRTAQEAEPARRTESSETRIRLRDAWPRRDPRARDLPPGQRVVRTLPRFGLHLAGPLPAQHASPTIEVRGAVAEPLELPLAAFFSDLPRCVVVADFHCVAGWSVRRLRWEGVAVRTLYERLIVPRAKPAAGVSHLAFVGRDGHRSVLTVDDALADDVLIADRLDDAPLPREHGAPARLLSPNHYGYKSTKHLCRIELHTGAPRDGQTAPLARVLVALVSPHPRGRVWEEERHRHLPAWSVRLIYRTLVPVVAYLGAAGTRRRARPSARPVARWRRRCQKSDSAQRASSA